MRHTADINLEYLAKLKRVGFWRSEGEPFLPDPRTMVDQSWEAGERDRVIAYLESSFYVPIAQCGPSWCRFGCSPRPADIGTQDLTDGTWVFPEGLFTTSVHIASSRQSSSWSTFGSNIFEFQICQSYAPTESKTVQRIPPKAGIAGLFR